jgi:hypothetical protein
LAGRKPLGLRPYVPKAHKNADKLIETVNIHPYFALLITEKMVTLNELKTVYSMSDIFDLIEVIQVNSYNRRLLSE